MRTAYISSTFKDLQSHRQVVHTVVNRFGYHDVAMEYYVAEDEGPVDRCLADVAACDLYIGVFAWRYGFVPEENNPKKLSVTELEYQHAKKLKKPRLLFVIDEEAEWPMKFVDIDRGPIVAFHGRLKKDRLSGMFSTPDSLAALLSASLEKRAGNIPSLAPAKSFDASAYAKFLRRRYHILDLSSLTEPKRDEDLRLQVQSVFVEQDVKDDPPPSDLPKEAWQMLVSRKDVHAEDLPAALAADLDLKTTYLKKPPRPVFQVLADPDHRASIILGDPGSGKSTLLKYLVLALTDVGVNPKLQPALAGRTPFLVDLRSYVALRAEKRCDTLLGYFEVLSKEENCPVDANAIEEFLASSSPAVLMFDGLDEIFDPADQESITKQIIGVADKYPEARVIVTSRIIGYRRTLLTNAGFHHFTLQDLNAEQVSAFVRQWYALTHAQDAKTRVERIEKSFRSTPSVRQLAGNPMLLTIMAIIGKHQELPKERWKLYDHATTVLVMHWEVNKHIRDKQLGDDFMDEEDKKELLRRLAWAMQSGKEGLAGNYIHADELQQIFESYLRDRYAKPPAEAKTIAKAMIQQFHQRNFILSFYGAKVYGFVHRAFLEYFCADWIRTRFEKTKDLPLDALLKIVGEHWQDKAWHEVIRLVCGMIGEEFAAEIVEYLLNFGWNATEGRSVVLAIECLSELRRIDLVAETAARALTTLLDAYVVDDGTHWSPVLDAVIVAEQIPWPDHGCIENWIKARRHAPISGNRLLLEIILGKSMGRISSGSERVRAVLLESLKDSKSHSSLTKLFVRMLGSGWDDSDVRDTLMAVAEYSPDPGVISSATSVLSERYKHDADVVEWILNRPQTPNVVMTIITSLRENVRAVPVMLDVLSSTYSDGFRRRAAQGLAFHLENAGVRDALEHAAAHDKDATVRDAATKALKRI
jgi:Domain of unknown function (DUF4062)/NACHT domain